MTTPHKYLFKFKLTAEKPNSWVYVPTERSMTLGRNIKNLVEQNWQLPENYYHLQRGGHLKALQAHQGNNFFIHVDIKNFFYSISRNRVSRVLKPYFGHSVAREFSHQSTISVKTKAQQNTNPLTILPFGFVQSPILASLCLYKSSLGSYLRRLSNSGFTTSVYMDDILLSVRDEEMMVHTIHELNQHAQTSGFSLNANKQEGPAPQVTAFNIKLNSATLAITQNRLEKFLDAYQATECPMTKQAIKGYIASVNADQCSEFVRCLPL